MSNNSLLTQQLEALLKDETNTVANLANAAVLLNQSLNQINWVGFYLYQPETDQLDLGPFQGKVACMHIINGTGVVGTAFAQQKTQVVADVHQFKGHIACDSATNSEIVVPLANQKGVLDIDSVQFNRFSQADQAELENFVVALNHYL